MSEFLHDDFAQDYLTELLSNIGTSVPNKVIKSECREGDIWFERNPALTIAQQRQTLGLMGQFLSVTEKDLELSCTFQVVPVLFEWWEQPMARSRPSVEGSWFNSLYSIYYAPKI
jgi:hypothetical protein